MGTGSLTTGQLQRCVCSAVDALIEAAEPYAGLFPSVLERHNGRMPWILPPAIAGQRDEDRSFPGANLSHDQSVLRLMLDWSAVTGEPQYAQAARRYLARFATHCANTPSGLFPWGEHSFWNLAEDRIGNSYPLMRTRGRLTHDHLLQAPVWLWDELWSIRPECILHFARGLGNHWVAGDPAEYQRHAAILTCGPNTERGPRSCDFPRHSGFYVLDLACAFAKSDRPEFLQQAQQMADYWWLRREPDAATWPGLLAIESRSPASEDKFRDVLSAVQTLSLGVSLLEAAQVLSEGLSPQGRELAATLNERGRAYIRAFLDTHRRVPGGMLVDSVRRGDSCWARPLSVWGSQYGAAPAAAFALLACKAFRLNGEQSAIEFATLAAQQYVGTPFPDDRAVVAKDAGAAISLLTELSLLTQQRSWVDAALELAQGVVPRYFDAGLRLPRGASTIEWYESQMLPGYLLAALARLSLVAEGGAAPYAADLSMR